MKKRLILTLFISCVFILFCICVFLSVILTPFSFPIWLITGKNMYKYIWSILDIFEIKFNNAIYKINNL